MPTPLQRSTKLKILHWYFYQCLYPKISSSVKNILSERFSKYFFTHIHLMRCSSSTVNLIAVTTLLWRPVDIAASKEYVRIIQIIFMLLPSAFSFASLSKIFVRIWLLFLRVMQENTIGCLFWTRCVIWLCNKWIQDWKAKQTQFMELQFKSSVGRFQVQKIHAQS